MSKQESPLVLEKLSKNFGKNRGINNVSLELRPGEVFGFLGPNGAGKSTTIRLIMDFLRPSSGQVNLLGGSTSAERSSRHNQVGYLAGEVALYENMTGRSLLKYLSTLDRSVDWDYVMHLSDRFEVVLDQKIKTLSKGNRQKIGLIQACMHRPKLIVMDEPTSGLDPLMKQVFYDVIREMASDGSTAFISSHDLHEVQKLCDRAGFIREGELIAIEKITQKTNVETRRYVVKFRSQPKVEDYQNITAILDAKNDGEEMVFVVRGDISQFIDFIAKYRPISLRESEIELEELFMHYYQKDKK